MKTLEDYTPEIRGKVQGYKDRAVKELYDGTEHKNWKRENTVKYIEYVYNLGNQEMKPLVIVANNPKEYKLFYNLLFNDKYSSAILPSIEKASEAKNSDSFDTQIELDLQQEIADKANLLLETNSELISANSHWVFLLCEYSRVYLTWFKFIKDEFKLDTTKAEQLDWLYENVNQSNIAKTYLTDMLTLVLRMPQEIKRNEIGFHSTDSEGAIVYDNLKMHYLNGRRMPDWVFDEYLGEDYFNKFMAENNEDVKAGVITLIKERDGNEGLLKFLKAELIDEQTLNHADGNNETIRLYKTKETYSFLQDRFEKPNQPYCWSEMVCPSTGNTYLIDNSADFTDALEAIKFLRPSFVPQELLYNWENFSN
jgi:hypothetical protein